MQSFSESSATKFVLGMLVAHILTAIVPMLDAHAIDFWALGKVVAVDLAALLINALRPDVNAPGLNWFGPKQ